MGVCLSKAGHGHDNLEEDGFCTPEAASEQYESPNPSGRYSYGLDTPRISADVGDLGALGSLFYKRGSRSRDTPHLNYISPLEMFLGGVSGRNRVHHVNQMCTGDFSFASYLSSPLLKGFDVHAMEAVAKSYAESAAKAAARDAFVFLEENDVCSSFTASPAKVLSEDTGDVDDDYAKSGESEDWEDHLRKSEDWDARVSHSDNDRSRFHGTPTNDRFDSVLNAVQARAKARRRQRRKSAAASKDAGAKERVVRKMVRFQVPAESEEGCTDDDLRSCMESEGEAVLAQAEADAQTQEEMRRAAFYAKAKGSGQQVDKFVDQRERTALIGTAGLASLRLQEEEDEVDEFRGFSFAPGAIDGASGGATPLVGPRSATAGRTSSAGGSGSEESSADYYLPCSSLSSSSNQRDEVTALPLNDNDDEAMSPETSMKDEDCWEGAYCDERKQQHCSNGNGTGDVPQRAEDFSFQGGNIDYGIEPQEFNFQCQGDNGAPSSQSLEKPAVMSDIPTPIPVGCVVVESRLPDGRRDTPQILELSDVELPEMSGNHSGFFTTRILHSGDPSPTSEHNASYQEGSFTFPCLLVPTSSFSECSPFREPRGLWKDPPITDLRSSSRNHSYRCQPPPPPLSTAPTASSSHAQVHLDISSPRSSCSDDLALPRYSFSFDIEPTVTKRPHEIVLPSLPPRSLPSSPGKFPSMPSRSSPLFPMQQPTAPYPPRSRRGMNKKLKFYSLERASFAAGAKRSKSPSTFVRRQRREDNEGDSSSDLFEIETMSGTNAMGSSRTPPSTPTKILKVSPAAAFDFNRLSNSIAQVSRSRSKRVSSKDKPLPLAPSREKGRCLEKNRVNDQESSSTLKGRAFLKLGLLRRSKFSSGRSHKADTDFYKSSETSGSEYLENKPPSQDPGNEMPPMRPHMDDEKLNTTANLALEWYCSNVAQRRGLGPEKRHLYTYHRRSCSEDRTFAVKN